VVFEVLFPPQNETEGELTSGGNVSGNQEGVGSLLEFVECLGPLMLVLVTMD